MLIHAERLLREAGDLHYEVRQAVHVPGADEPAEAFPSRLLKLAHAMYVHAKRFDPATEAPAQDVHAHRIARGAADLIRRRAVAGTVQQRSMPEHLARLAEAMIGPKSAPPLPPTGPSPSPSSRRPAVRSRSWPAYFSTRPSAPRS